MTQRSQSAMPFTGATKNEKRRSFSEGLTPPRSLFRKGEGGSLTSYYRQPALKAPEWGWKTVLYFFLGGLAAGAYVVATLAHLFGTPADRPVVRAGRYLALVAAALSPFLLIADLGRPERFTHVLRIVKTRSPMSMGAWGLSGFGLFVGLGALGQAVEDGFLRRSSPLGRVATLVPLSVTGVLGSLFSFFVGSYTGVLLSFTNVPLWAKNRLLQGPLFLASALSTGLAGISLVLLARSATGETSPETRRWLRRAGRIAVAGEAGLLGGTLVSLGSLARPLLRPPSGVFFWLGSVGLGLIVPLTLQPKEMEPGGRPSAMDVLVDVSILTGGLCLRVATILAGRQSIRNPSARKQEIHEAVGAIVLAQEDRFRVETADGRSLLLVLGDRARASLEDLERWAGSGRRVHVRYRGEPEAGAVALEVRAAHR